MMVGGLPLVDVLFARTSAKGGVCMQIVLLRGGYAFLISIIGVIASVICAIVSIVELLRDIIKDKKKNSNHPTKG